jgi:hypothetical protein
MISADDRLALSDLVHCYAAMVDERQFDSVAALFTKEAQLTLPDPPKSLEPVHAHRGHAAISAAIATVGGTIRTQHAIVGEVYDAGPRPGTAGGRIACIAHHWIEHDGEIRDAAWHVRYDDQYQRVNAGWRIRNRSLTIDAIEIRPVRQVRPPAG